MNFQLKNLRLKFDEVEIGDQLINYNKDDMYLIIDIKKCKCSCNCTKTKWIKVYFFNREYCQIVREFHSIDYRVGYRIKRK